MNCLLIAPVHDKKPVRAVTHIDGSASAHQSASLMARIEWCQRLQAKARTDVELEGWGAEEEGLRDVLLGKDRMNPYQYSSAVLRDRYALGLEDGRLLIRIEGREMQQYYKGNKRLNQRG